MLERRALHHPPISVASSPAWSEPMSGTRDRPMLVEESPAPHYIMVEDSPAPPCIVVEESLVPMSGVKDRPCLVVESPEPTKDRAGTTSPVPMSGTKDCPSLVDDSPAMPKVNNLCCRGGNPVEGGSATLPINLLSPPTTTSPTGDPQLRILPNWGGDPEVATGLEPVFASPPRTQSPMVVHESQQYIVVDESPPPPPQPNTVGPVSPPPSPRPRQVAYMEQVQGIPHLIRPSCGGGSGGGHSSSGGAPAPVAARSTPPSCPAGGPSGPSVAGGAAGGSGGGSSPPFGGGGPSFRHSGGLTQTQVGDDLQHTCGCPRCVVHYETCIQSLMAQVKDLRTQNLELQRSHQEPSQAVASTAGISQCYGDRTTQILSTLAKLDAAVQGCRRDSKVMEASVVDHLKMSNSNTAKCFSPVELLTTRYAAVVSRIDAWDHWYSTPAEPVTVVLPPPSAPPPVSDPEAAAPTAPMGAPSSSSGDGSVLPFSVHPSHDCIYHQDACPDLGWPRGGGEHHGHPTPKNLLRGGEVPKSRRNLLSPSGGRRLRAKNTPRSLRPRGPMRRRAPLRWGRLIPSQKMFSLPLRNLCTRRLILRTRVQSLQ